jgi:DNA-directed RNA polymerase subunit RPC12/RpoP
MDFVLLNSYNNYIEAHIAKGVLEEHGISSWLQDDNTITINPILTNAVGGIKLMVAGAELLRSREILDELRQQQKQAVTCPQCGSHNTELVSTPRKAVNWLSAISTFFLGDYAIAVAKVNHCFDCGHEFPQKEQEVAD